MKYMGSKSRITKYIIPIINKYIEENDVDFYLEPFAGGMNVIDKVNFKYKIANDSNKYLIKLFKHLVSGGELPEDISKEEYSKVRSNQKDYEDWYIGCVGFLASYNGRFFDGGFAKPGYEGKRYRNYYKEAKSNILKQVKDLKNIKFTILDYKDFEPKNGLIYCDPPYQDTKQYNNSKNFNYEEFWNKMREWSKDNIVIISELKAPKDFECIWEQEVSRSIKTTDKSKATEKLFVYKGG